MTDRIAIHNDPQSHDLNGLGENKIQSDANSALVIVDPALPKDEAEQLQLLESPAQKVALGAKLPCYLGQFWV
jgi:hypothetical protein